ncbi:hypothetical protein A4H97_21085 [Niastella yeongjuensis]|uniref:Iron dicitrate transport regulator FecR n=1 Tax=Niastella yeongjuensis TaxID=354355 RepID=A0A1V9FCH6_9BACT|nr:FecR domain-containing protein [Niastella yeongjuensis]OQP56075.1 hypothetical protein A4H97_21085 [Niastella yeongjuensis]SEP23887.1 FecR family protein [Niastella yeongjuensis]
MNGLNRLLELAFKHLSGELSEDESKELEYYLNESPENRVRFEKLTNHDSLIEGVQAVYSADKKRMWHNIVVASPKWQKKGQVIAISSSLKYAVAIIIVIAITAYWFIGRHSKTEETKVISEVSHTQNDILPGGNKATLTLASGRKITLDDAANGRLAKEGKTDIVKTADGQLAYTTAGAATGVYYNTVSTPKGGQYQLTLPDGTKIWMNAASTLHFPTSFTGNERLVELDGEAYFEVAKNVHMPFVVKTKNGMAVQVLGTRFNIMAYNEERDTKATLIDGSIRVSNGAFETVLHPGQQALSETGNTGTDVRVNKDADIEEAVAWKNGTFSFNNADVRTIMRQIARWYDVDISYDGQLPEKHFTGTISRNLRASEVLSGIEFIGVHFKIDGKKIVVQP